MRIFLDAVTVIFLVEKVHPFVDQIRVRLTGTNLEQVVSELSRLECRVKPIRDQDPLVLQAFDTYFTGVVDEIVPLSRQVVDRATNIRAHYNFKVADSLQLAAAVESGCDLVLTGDRKLQRFTDLPVESLY